MAYTLSNAVDQQKKDMQQVILTLISEKEKLKNSMILKKFQAAFLSRDMEDLDSILDESGSYFRKMSKGGVMAYFYRCFKETRSIVKTMNIVVNKGFSSDTKPCQPVLEFRFPEFDPFTGNDYDLERPLGAEPNAMRNELVYRFAFSLCDGKIVSIRIPKACKESLETEIRLN